MTTRPILSLKKKTAVTSEIIEPTPQKKAPSKEGINKNKQEIKEARKLKEEGVKQAQIILNTLDFKSPLAIGIGKELKRAIQAQAVANHQTISHKMTQIAIQRLVTSEEYLTCLMTGTHRYYLDGSEATEITPEEREFAKQEIERKQAIREARRLERQTRKKAAKTSAE